MLDARLLKMYAGVVFLTALIFLVDSKAHVGAAILLLMSSFLMIIAWSVKPNRIDIRVRDLFGEAHEATNALKDKLKTDAEFNQALVYVHNLDRASFLTFFRIAVETRLEADRHLLRDAARLYRNTPK